MVLARLRSRQGWLVECNWIQLAALMIISNSRSNSEALCKGSRNIIRSMVFSLADQAEQLLLYSISKLTTAQGCAPGPPPPTHWPSRSECSDLRKLNQRFAVCQSKLSEGRIVGHSRRHQFNATRRDFTNIAEARELTMTHLPYFTSTNPPLRQNKMQIRSLLALMEIT